MPVRRCISVLFLFLTPVFGLFSQDVFLSCGHSPDTVPTIRWATTVALVDGETGAVLYEQQGERPWPPASLTKLVSIFTAFEAVSEGSFSLSERRAVDPRAYASAVPPGSSLMFLGPDQQPNGEDLVNGLVISSGNDASVELALRVAGSVERFVAQMNERSRLLGYDRFVFYDPAGLSGANRITAIDFARFAADLLRMYPETLDYTSRRSFTWPPDAAHGITQENRNGLVASYPGADGLKTGYIEESGYNIAVSARREGMRLIAVVLGVQADNHAEGARRREADATSILDWGFDTWTVLRPTVPPMPSLQVYGGAAEDVDLFVDGAGRLLLLRRDVPRLRGELSVADYLWAPIEANVQVGTVRYRLDDCTVAEYSVRTAESVEPGGLLRRLWDRLRWWWLRLNDRVSSVRGNWFGGFRSAGLENRTKNRDAGIPSTPGDCVCASISSKTIFARPQG